MSEYKIKYTGEGEKESAGITAEEIGLKESAGITDEKIELKESANDQELIETKIPNFEHVLGVIDQKIADFHVKVIERVEKDNLELDKGVTPFTYNEIAFGEFDDIIKAKSTNPQESYLRKKTHYIKLSNFYKGCDRIFLQLRRYYKLWHKWKNSIQREKSYNTEQKRKYGKEFPLNIISYGNSFNYIVPILKLIIDKDKEREYKLKKEFSFHNGEDYKWNLDGEDLKNIEAYQQFYIKKQEEYEEKREEYEKKREESNKRKQEHDAKEWAKYLKDDKYAVENYSSSEEEEYEKEEDNETTRNFAKVQTKVNNWLDTVIFIDYFDDTRKEWYKEKITNNFLGGSTLLYDNSNFGKGLIREFSDAEEGYKRALNEFDKFRYIDSKANIFNLILFFDPSVKDKIDSEADIDYDFIFETILYRYIGSSALKKNPNLTIVDYLYD